jgi:putative NADH-flavin reductase
MKVVVFGASGRVGSRVVELLLAEGHEVFAVVHSRDIFQGTPHLYVRKMDVHDAAAVAEVLGGAGAVISTLSSWGSKQGDVLSSAMRAIIPAMDSQNVKRIVSLTGNAAFIQEDKPSLAQKAGRAMLQKIAPGVVADGEKHMAILRKSDLDWTVLRSPTMNNRGKEDYVLSAKLSNPTDTINRQAVAKAMVAELHDSTWLRKAPNIWRP